MAKVYDAMRRAEEERRRLASLSAPPGTDGLWEEPEASMAPSKSIPLWRRMLQAGSNRSEDGANDMNKRRISLLQPDSFVAEQFRTLRGRIDSVAAHRPITSIAVSSANSNEGKSTASINLAAVTAMSLGRKVLLVDCDLRRARVHSSLGLNPESGIAEVLLGQASLDEAIVKVGDLNLEVLGVRQAPPNPSELLASSQMRELVAEVSSRYDRVILDTPATLGLPDSKIVSELCDGLVVVVRAGVTPREDLHATLDILDSQRLLGVVLNGVEASRDQYGYY
jgi:capsular exopolysaccharide synthesis family protein